MEIYNNTKTYYAIQKAGIGFFQYEDYIEEEYDEEGNLVTFCEPPCFVDVDNCYAFETREAAENFLYNSDYVTKAFPEKFKKCIVTKVTITMTQTL